MQHAIQAGQPDALWRELWAQAQKMTQRDASLEETVGFVQRFLQVSDISPVQLAETLSVAPQTVHRWVRGSVQPRRSQMRKISGLIEAALQASAATSWPPAADDSIAGNTPAAMGALGTGALGMGALGIHFFDTIVELKAQAREVWIIQNGALREATRGFMGEAVLRGLKNGTNFHYVFRGGGAAESTFLQHLKPWLEQEHFSGAVTGYGIQDCAWASSLGLTQAPGGWAVLEYSEAQVHRLQRRYDVFKALAVREYTDASRQRVKNEDGQPCWLEVATPHASLWIERINDLRRCLAGPPTRGTIQVARIAGLSTPGHEPNSGVA